MPAQAALLYTALRAGGVGLLAALLGFSLTAVPPVFPLVLAAGAVASWPLATRLVLLGAVAPLVWWPSLQAQAAVTTVVPARQLPLAVLLGTRNVVGGGLLLIVIGLLVACLRLARAVRNLHPPRLIRGGVAAAAPAPRPLPSC